MLRNGPELNWVVSYGPLLLVPGEHLPSWGGIDPPADGRHIDAQFRWNCLDDRATDYDRACDVTGYVGLLDIGAGQGLILGDDPLSTTWQPAATAGDGMNDTGGLLIRPVYANSDADVIAALAHVPQIAWRDEGLVLGVGHEPLYLLNATCPGSELESDGYMTIHLQPGRYAIATAEYAPDSDTSLLLHRLTRISSAPSDTGRTILL